MLSVAVLDFVQMVVMLGGLPFVAYLVSGKVDFGGAAKVISSAAADASSAFSLRPTLAG